MFIFINEVFRIATSTLRILFVDFTRPSVWLFVRFNSHSFCFPPPCFLVFFQKTAWAEFLNRQHHKSAGKEQVQRATRHKVWSFLVSECLYRGPPKMKVEFNYFKNESMEYLIFL